MSLGVGEARNTRRSTKQSTGTVLNELEDYSRNLKASPSAGDFAKIRTLDRLGTQFCLISRQFLVLSILFVLFQYHLTNLKHSACPVIHLPMSHPAW
jgi:hypothetical protein